jgi:hypothetical protein
VRVRARLSLRAALRRPQRCWGAASPRVAARGEG